mmetsp:Transcript_22877/g.67548  ORF Transcript_22877/g.67548 Transcript_22877/m.67548 type:complete len:93 (+) Transcript_22877:3129-3407(+)
MIGLLTRVSDAEAGGTRQGQSATNLATMDARRRDEMHGEDNDLETEERPGERKEKFQARSISWPMQDLTKGGSPFGQPDYAAPGYLGGYRQK